MGDSKSSVENQLLAEISKIDLQIEELNRDKQAIQRLLVKVRREDLNIRDVSRRNSLDRIVIEDIIVRSLKVKENGMKTEDIFKQVLSYKKELKSTTFRSYLNRMKEKGILKAGMYGRGYWKLSVK